jgi:hypothetical protein
MRPSRIAAFLLLAPAALTACASGGGSGIEEPRDYNVITFEEIQATEAETAFQIIQQLRPRWMVRNRGQRSLMETEADYAKVIVDDLPPREFDFLRELAREILLELRFLEAREATLLYGTGYNAGVVKVKTRR